MRKALTYREFMQWAAWSRHQPIGDERCFDLGPALIRQTMVDMHTPRGGRHYPLDDYLPFHYRRPGLSDVDEALIAWAKSMGASENG